MKKPPDNSAASAPSTSSGQALRRLAEERLKARAQTPCSAPALNRVEGLPVPRSDERLVHELQVHQIQLEMQNEELLAETGGHRTVVLNDESVAV